jgi:hypothetical protein
MLAYKIIFTNLPTKNKKYAGELTLQRKKSYGMKTVEITHFTAGS